MVSVVVCSDLSGKQPHRHVHMERVIISGSLGGVMVSVVVCSDLSGKQPHRHVHMERVITYGSLGGVMLNTLGQNACGFDSRCRCTISNFHQVFNASAVTGSLYKCCAVCLLNIPCVSIYEELCS